MSDADAAVDPTRSSTEPDVDTRARLGALRRRFISVGRAVFGDRTGLLVWLGLVLALSVLWRVGIFITDTYTIANTLVNVADGHLAITKIEYSLTMGTQPGLHQYEGALYGRNYGQAFLALPVLWVLELGAAVAEPRFVLLGGWALGALAFASQLGVRVGRQRQFAIAGSTVAIAVVLLGVRLGTPLDPQMLGLAALQLSTLLAAATVGLLAYRLLAMFEGPRVGVAAGVAAGLATPVGFWASIPKRHVLVSALILAAVYCFARSRRTGNLRFRAGAYAFAGLVAWIHAFEGFFVVVTLASVDLATARDNGVRELAVVALVLLVALSPTFATNTAIAGNPLQSPRLLPGVGVGDVELAPTGDLQAADATSGVRTGGGGGDFLGGGGNAGADGGTSGGSGANGGPGASDGSGPDGAVGGSENGSLDPIGWAVGLAAALVALLAGLVGAVIGLLPRPPDTVLVVLSFVVTTVTDGLAALTEPDRLWHVFVRSGHVPGVRYEMTEFEVLELTVLESMPLLGALAALPACLAASVRRHGRDVLRWPRSMTPARQTDLLAGAIAVVFVVIYLSRVPLQAMFTMRYLFPIYPLGLYAVARLGPVAGAVSAGPRRTAIGYVATVAIGGLVVLGALRVLDPALGEAVQFHALLNLAAATVLAVAVTARAALPDRVEPTWVAGALALAAGVTTIYLVLAGLAYFPYGEPALDVARVLVEALSTLV